MKYIFLLCFGLISLNLIAQDFVTEEYAPQEAKEWYYKGREFSSKNQYEKAIEAYQKALAIVPKFIDAQLFIADAYYGLNNFEEAEVWFEKVVKVAPTYNTRVLYVLGALEYRLEKYDEAVGHLKQFFIYPQSSERLVQSAKQLLANCEFAAEAVKNPVPFNPVNLGEINTENPEYLPCFTADGNTMIYTTRVGGQEDFYESKKVDGKWQKGKDLGEPINTPDNEGAQTISADGRLLVYTVCNRNYDYGSCDLYFSEFINGEWTTPKNMGPQINTRGWESQPSLSADGRTLYFASSNAGGMGKKDIWVTYRKPDGTWLLPMNLGKNINTSGDDESPFIHADGQTLYFRSNGHVGMGGYDLYQAKRQPDGSWGELKNLGYPINSNANEGSLVVSLDGKTGYFASDREDSKGATDLYSFEMPESIRPKPVTYVKAHVFDAKTKNDLKAKVEVVQLSTGYIYTESTTTEQGAFLVCLPAGDDYALNVTRKGYLFFSENFAFTDASSFDQPFLIEAPLQKIEAIDTTAIAVSSTDNSTPISTPVILKNVFFESGSAALKASSKSELQQLKSLLEENPSLKIQINGHTDNVGSDAANLELSLQRATAVVNFLVEKGINKSRLSAKGFGETMPIDTNETAEGRRNNRRTEFEIIK